MILTEVTKRLGIKLLEEAAILPVCACRFPSRHHQQGNLRRLGGKTVVYRSEAFRMVLKGGNPPSAKPADFAEGISSTREYNQMLSASGAVASDLICCRIIP